MSNSLPLQGENDKKLGATMAPLSVSATDTPSSSVRIRAGSFWNASGQLVEYPGGVTPTIIPPSSAARWALISLNGSGGVEITYGATSASPSIPAPSPDTLPLAAIFQQAGTTNIVNTRINDVRPVFQTSDAVSNIAQQLSIRPTFTDVAADLATKADVTGTPSALFNLNVNNTTAASTSGIVVERGADAPVSIRYNSSTSKWEFTNDGINFGDIPAASGVYAPIVHTHVHTDITDWNSAINVSTQTKMDKIVGGTVGNVAVIDSTGNVIDGGESAADFALLSDLALKANTTDVVHNTGVESIGGPKTFTDWLTVTTPSSLPLTLFTQPGDAGLEITRPGGNPAAQFKWDETSQTWQVGLVGGAMSSVLTSAVVDDKMDKVVGAVSGNIAIFGAGGQVFDTGLAPSGFVNNATLSSMMALKADVVHQHTTGDITNFTPAVNGAITSALSTATFAQSQVTNLVTDLAGKMDNVVAIEQQLAAFDGTNWIGGDISTGRLLWVNDAGNPAVANGTINRPYTTIQDAIDNAPGTNSVILVMPRSDGSTNWEGFTIHNRNNITIQGWGLTDAHAVRVDGAVTISGTTTRAKLKDLSIWSTTTTEVPLTIQDTEGRHFFDNVTIERFVGSTVPAVEIAGILQNWVAFVFSNVGGPVMLGGTPAADTIVSFRNSNHPLTTITVDHDNYICMVYDTPRIGHTTHAAGQLLMKNVAEITPTSGVGITSTASATGNNRLVLQEVNMRRFSGNSNIFSAINKPGACDYFIGNCTHDLTLDVLTGNRIVYGTDSSDVGFVHTPVNFTASENVDEALKAIDVALGNKPHIVAVPGTSSSAGNTGDIAFDSSYIYVCISPNTWVRSPAATW